VIGLDCLVTVGAGAGAGFGCGGEGGSTFTAKGVIWITGRGSIIAG